MMFINKKRNNLIRKEIINNHLTSFMTDDERALFFGLPEGCRMRENAKILSRENLKCGKYVWIGEGAILDASGGLIIGDHTSIGLNTLIWSHSSYLANLALENKINSDLITRKTTRIGSGCFISGPSVIYPGVTIGNKVIVLSMSVVTTDIPDYSMISGSPAKVIKTLNEQYIKTQIDKIRHKHR
jgi:acetyltransferase-like isoleucine patch superfamily enzyme